MSSRDTVSSLRDKPENNKCADCGEECPEWASVTLGVFLCIACAGLHRRLGVDVSRVRSVRLDTWSEEMCQRMVSGGNSKAKKRWEANVPLCWVPPNPKSRQVCREQWIRAKYERREFTEDTTDVRTPYITGLRHGMLYKRKKASDEWNKRWFVLSTETLSYYKSYQDRTPKGILHLSHLNLILDYPGLEETPTSMLITFRAVGGNSTRNIFVYAETGKELMDWFCAVRMAKMRLLQEVFPGFSLEEVIEKASREFIKTGYLCKMPPTQKKFQKRFFVLDGNCLRYYDRPKDAYPLGEILLGTPSSGYWVDENVPERLQHHMNIFMLHVPGRTGGGFPLQAEDSASKHTWMVALKEAIESFRKSPDFGHGTMRITYEKEEAEEEDGVKKRKESGGIFGKKRLSSGQSY